MAPKKQLEPAMRLCTSAAMAEPVERPPVIPFTVRVGQRMRQETEAVVDESLPSEMEQLLGRLAEAHPAAQPKPGRPPGDATTD